MQNLIKNKNHHQGIILNPRCQVQLIQRWAWRLIIISLLVYQCISRRVRFLLMKLRVHVIQVMGSSKNTHTTNLPHIIKVCRDKEDRAQSRQLTKEEHPTKITPPMDPHNRRVSRKLIRRSVNLWTVLDHRECWSTQSWQFIINNPTLNSTQ